LIALLALGGCNGDPPQQDPDNVQVGGRVVDQVDWSDDEGVLSPPILVGPLLACATAVRVTGFIPGADVRILRNGTDDIGGAEGWDPDGQMFPLTDALEIGWEITAVQIFGGATSPPSNSGEVQAITDAYPGGLPRPEIAALPLHDCGVATLPTKLPMGGEVRIFTDAQTSPIGSRTGVNETETVGVNPAFDEGDDITVESQICDVVSNRSIGYEVEAAPTSLPEVVIDELFENGTMLIVSKVVNGAKITAVNLTTGNTIGGGGAPSGRVRFRINPSVSSADQVEVVQELCGNTSPPTVVTVNDCSELPPPVLIGPQPGDDRVYLSGVVAGSRIVILAGTEEIGDGGGSMIALTRPVEAGETLTAIQLLGDCVSNGGYQVDVGTGLNDPGDGGSCTFERFEYGQNDEYLTDVASFFNSPAGSVPYSMDAVPIHGVVSYPTGAGSYPIALLVHGNSSPSNASETGYNYILDNLASHCIIAVSVDENFLNGVAPGAGEIDARAMVLLRHLQLWREWNQDPTNDFFTEVDLGRVMLWGHSRGGEAVTVAEKLNQWLHDPASPSSNFGFGINSLVAIAPTDAQVLNDISAPLAGLPFDQELVLDSAPYLVVQGSRDGDVSGFSGHRFYDRAFAVDDAAQTFKSLLFIHGPNHTQFNVLWESLGGATATILKEQTQAIAETYTAAMALVTLKGLPPYRALFKGDATFASIPSTVVKVAQYQDEDRTFLDHLEDDDNLTTATLAGVANSVTGSFDPYEDVTLISSLANYDVWQQTDAAGLGYKDGSAPEWVVNLDPAPAVRWRDHRNLGFRIGQVNDPADDFNPTANDQDLRVQVFWGAVPGPEVRVSDYTRLVYPDHDAFRPKSIMSSVRIRWADLKPPEHGEDLDDPTRIILRFDQRPSGWVILDEIQFTE
jgi:Cutinase